MNICCGGDFDEEKLRYSKIKIEVEEGKLNFENNTGVFTYKNTVQEKENKSEIDKLKKKLEELDEKKKKFEEEIKDLNYKIKNIEKILFRDTKENLYIKDIGPKNLEYKKLVNNN